MHRREICNNIVHKPITMHVPTLCDWFGSSASASDSDNLVFTRSEAERKRRRRQRNRNAVFTRHKLYASDYDSDSDFVASENQP